MKRKKYRDLAEKIFIFFLSSFYSSKTFTKRKEVSSNIFFYVKSYLFPI